MTDPHAAPTADGWLVWMENPEAHMGLGDRAIAAQTIRAELASVRAQLEKAREALRVFALKVQEHVEALPDYESGVWDEDAVQVASSLDHWAHGDPGCTEEDDYASEEWATLQAVAAALASDTADPEPPDIPGVTRIVVEPSEPS